MKRYAMLMAAMLTMACSPERRAGPPTVEVTAAPTDDYYGWAQAPDVTPRSLNVASVAAVQWGGDERDLEGLVIHVVGKVYSHCGNAFACTLMASNGDNDVYIPTDMMGGGYPYCTEMTPLAHEVGHIVLGGDRDHRDPRWCDPVFWAKMAEALRPAVPANDAQCLRYLADYLWYTGEGFCFAR